MRDSWVADRDCVWTVIRRLSPPLSVSERASKNAQKHTPHALLPHRPDARRRLAPPLRPNVIIRDGVEEDVVDTLLVRGEDLGGVKFDKGA